MNDDYIEGSNDYPHSGIVITGLFDPERYVNEEVYDVFDADLVDIFLYCITQTLLLDLSIKGDRIKRLRLNVIKEKLSRLNSSFTNNS